MALESQLKPAPALEALVQSVSLFLDLDGVIAAIEPHPDKVVASPSRTAVLEALALKLEGRLAIISGRTIAEIDRICEGAVPTVAGVHGLEMRVEGEEIPNPKSVPPEAQQWAEDFASAHPAIYLESKGLALALHYRKSPALKDEVRRQANEIASLYGLTVQSGHCVEEIRVVGSNKGDALRTMMARPPFNAGMPIMLGDDRTDEAAFMAASELGGFGIRVAPQGESSARYRLEDTTDVMAWLSAFAFKDGED